MFFCSRNPFVCVDQLFDEMTDCFWNVQLNQTLGSERETNGESHPRSHSVRARTHRADNWPWDSLARSVTRVCSVCSVPSAFILAATAGSRTVSTPETGSGMSVTSVSQNLTKIFQTDLCRSEMKTDSATALPISLLKCFQKHVSVNCF